MADSRTGEGNIQDEPIVPENKKIVGKKKNPTWMEVHQKDTRTTRFMVYCTGNYIQYLIINYNGIDFLEKYV